MGTPTVGVVGLGQMGGSMARHLIDSGFDVVGADLDEVALAELTDYGAEPADSPAALAGRVDVVITSLPTPASVRSVYLDDDGVLAGAGPDLVALEMSTVDPDTVADVAGAAAECDVALLGAPVSGGPPNARDGTLTVMLGGERSVAETEPATAVLAALAGVTHHVGDVDAGHTLKLVNNVMSLGNLAIALEATTLAADRGLDPELCYDVLTDSGGTSAAFERVFPRVLDRHFEAEFSLGLAKKDLQLAMETAAAMDQPMAASGVVFNLFVEAAGQGLAGADVGALVQLFEASSDATVSRE